MTDTDLRAALERLLRMNDEVGEDMCPNCVTPWKCNGPHISPLEQARAALAAQAADGLDVERLARAIHIVECGDRVGPDPNEDDFTSAREYAAAYLHEPSREPGEELRREIVADTEATEQEPEQW